MDQDLVNELKRLRDEREKKFAEEDWEGALAVHDRILKLSPSALRHANRGSILFRLGRLEEAVESYRKALQMDPSQKRARADLERLEAQLQKQSGKSSTAAMPAMSDEEKQKKIIELRNQREKKLELQEWASALVFHNQILEIEPNALRYANQGSILYRMGKHEEAVAAYKKALELDPTQDRAKQDLEKIQSHLEEEGLLLAKSKEQEMESDDQDIQAKVEELRKKRQESIDAEDWPAALKMHDEILLLDPTALRYANRAALQYRLGRAEDAMQSYRKALELEPDLEKAREEMAKLQAEMEEEALLKAQGTAKPATTVPASKAKMSAAEIATRIAQLRDERQKYLDAKDWDKALSTHDQIIELEPTPLRYVNRGSMLYRMGELERAISDYRKALEMDPNLGRAKQDLTRMEEELKSRPPKPKPIEVKAEAKPIEKPAEIQKKKPDTEEAPKIVPVVAKKDTAQPQVKKLSGEELAKKLEDLRIKRQEMMDLGKWEEALTAQDEILALEPNALRYANRGSILYRLGRAKDSILSYREALDMDATLERAQEDLARIKDCEMEKLRLARQEKMDKDDWQGALDAHDIILALEPNALRYANRGSLLYRMNRVMEAKEAYLKALAIEPELQQAKEDLAQIEKNLQAQPVLMAVPLELQEDEEDILAVELSGSDAEALPAIAVEEIQPATKRPTPSGKIDSLATLSGHEKEVTQLLVTPDGSSLISASKDNTIRIWDLQTYKCIHTLKGHQDWVRAIAVTNKGDKVISGSDDWTIKVWDMAAGKCECTMSGHTMPIFTVAVSKNDHFVFSGSRDRTLRIWDIKNSKQVTNLEGHQDWVNVIRLVPDGDKAISASYDSTIRIWNVLGWRCTNTLQGHKAAIEKLLVHPDGKYIVSASSDRTIRIWEIPGGKNTATLEGHNDQVADIQMSQDGKLLVSGGRDECVYLWELPGGKLKLTLPAVSCRFDKVVFTPDNRFVLGAGSDNKIWVWDVESGKKEAAFEEHTQPVCAFLPLAKNNNLVSAGRDGVIKIWDCSRIGK
jgi:WD40 repeat protein/tetratricopeptide (TPR) repeat protein